MYKIYQLNLNAFTLLNVFTSINYCNCLLNYTSVITAIPKEITCTLQIINKSNPKIIQINDRFNETNYIYAKINSNFIQFNYHWKLSALEIRPKIEQYTFIDYTVNDLKQILLGYSLKADSWNPRALFLFVFLKTPTEDIQKLIQTCWQLLIINILFIYDNNIYTSYPFYNNSDTCGSTAVLTRLQTCDILPNFLKEFSKCHIDLLNIQSPPYVVKISDQKATGIVYLMMETVFNAMHIKFTLLPTKIVYLIELLHDAVITTVLKDMNGLRYFAALGPTAFIITKKDLVDYSVYTMLDQLIWIFPMPNEVPKWILYAKAFTIQLWAANNLFLIFTSTVFVMVAVYGYDRKYYRNHKIKCFLDLFSLNIGEYSCW